MNNQKVFIKFSLSALLIAGMTVSCKENFLERQPSGVFNEQGLTNLKGIEGTLIGAYATLNGRTDAYLGGGSNWVFGSIGSDESYKGSEQGDWTDLNQVEYYDVQPSNAAVYQKWDATFDGIGMANSLLRMLEKATDVSDEDRTRIAAEARFLRGWHHFEGVRTFRNIPYIDDKVTDYTAVSSDQPIWSQIEDDFKAAYSELPDKMPNVGRANKWAAAAYLAKVYLHQRKYAEAKPVLDDIIAKGVTANGVKYGLNEKFHDNFRIATKNSKESVFATQSSVKDGAQGFNGNYENALNYPHGAGDKPGGCCGFFQPSQNLVNSFKTDANGLPLLETFNQTDIPSDQALKSDEPFTPYAGTLDPRLDWTVGRRGIQYLDWGQHPGRSWIRDASWGGPYSPKKNVYYKEDVSNNYQPGTWGQATSSLNINLVRFADVLLWAAETEAELGNLTKSLEYVNQVRQRAANEAGFVKNPDGTPAANYKIGLYPSFPSKEFALQAIQFERKLELAMEGHRHFDLVRWGIAAPVLNAYIAGEVNNLPHLQGATFDAGKDEYYPKPANYVSRMPNVKQTQGY